MSADKLKDIAKKLDLYSKPVPFVWNKFDKDVAYLLSSLAAMTRERDDYREGARVEAVEGDLARKMLRETTRALLVIGRPCNPKQSAKIARSVLASIKFLESGKLREAHGEDCPCYGDEMIHSEDCSNCECAREVK